MTSRPVPSLLRGFSAPVNLTIDVSDRDLEFLMANDSDLFNRWQAANAYATRTLVQIVASLAAGRRSSRGTTYAKALSASLRDDTLEPAYRAELLKLPTQSDIAREIARNVDPDHIHRAHRQLSRIIATTLSREFASLYRAMSDAGPFSPDAKSAGRRALRNAVLTLLVQRGTAKDVNLAVRHLETATNMTDEAHALVLLSSVGGGAGDAALSRFFERWQHDHLVIDTWFAAQAVSPQPDTVDRVQRLIAHPLFSITTPNKVRALIGNFATMNPVQFNRPDGAGYQLVAEQVLAIDRFRWKFRAARAVTLATYWAAQLLIALSISGA